MRRIRDVVKPDVRRPLVEVVVCGIVLLTSFFYRFNRPNEVFGGFTNDQFNYLARARQIQAGEVPFRDFDDPGWLLADYASAAAQWLAGYSLRSETLLTVGMLSIGAALTFVLARRVAGSTVAGLAAVALHVALEPRHYNYPKIVLYAAGLALAWAYIDRPTRSRLSALGALTGVGFLFRHDHAVYLGGLSLVTILVVHRGSLRDAVRAAIRVASTTAVFVVPFLVFLSLNGGIGEYFRQAMVFIERDAERTSFSLPRFSIDPSKPLVAVTGGTADAVDINVRWRPVSDDERRDRESRYKLAAGTHREGTTWRYRLEDISRTNVEALVRDALVEDTSGIDRTTFEVEQPRRPLRVETQLDTPRNAAAFLYYTFVLLPVATAVALVRLRRGARPTAAWSSVPHLVPLLVLAVMLNIGFLSRGSTHARVADVAVTSSLLVAWLMTAVASRDAHLMIRGGVGRAALRAIAVLVLLVTALSVNGLSQTTRMLEETGFTRGPVAVGGQAALAWRRLGVHPGTLEHPPLLQVAAYVRACTAPGDRLFVLGTYPELYYFSDRLFAGGHPWLLPYYYRGEADQARIVKRLRQARPPIVLTEIRAEYDASYRDVLQHVHAYLEQEYRDIGEVHVPGAAPVRVLVRADRNPEGRYAPLGLECFAAADASTN